MADNRAIGVFDSGLGGLTVVSELLRYLPEESIVYFGDTGRVPYGTRSRETIKRYASEDEAFLLKNNVKLIIAACGTVSSVASEDASKLPVPYFEVVSHAAYSAAKETKNGNIGVLGTAATVNSAKHEKYIKEVLPKARVTACASSMLECGKILCKTFAFIALNMRLCISLVFLVFSNGKQMKTNFYPKHHSL